MSFFVVINEAGPAWDPRLAMREQKGWNDHAAFMDALEADHVVILGGPLKNYSKHKAMLVVQAKDEPALRMRLAEDPWMRAGILQNVELYPWEILLGKLL